MNGRGPHAPRCASALLAALALLAFAGACGGAEPPFEERRVAEVEAALAAAGLELCEATTPSRLIENTIDERWLSVALDCDAPHEETVVDVIAWPDRAARDEALRRFDVQSRPPAVRHGATWAFGQFTIHVSGTRAEAAFDRVAQAMNALGAS